MRHKLFTLVEANEALPLVSAITADAVDRYRRAKRAIHRLGRLQVARRSGRPAPAEAIRRQDGLVETHLDHLRGLVAELESVGCRLRDYDRGIVDFPAACLDGGHFLYYSWALGEPRVSHWHREAEGYRHRRRLPARAAQH